MFGDFDAAIASRALDFDVADVKFSNEVDRSFVLRSISLLNETHAPDSGPDERAPDTCLGYDLFNQRIRGKVAGPVLCEAAFNGDISGILRVVELCPGLTLDSETTRGVVGEKALHCAASAGNIEIALALLEGHFDINCQDMDGETPLHYATLAGHVSMVRLLLDNKADPERESFSAETALEVADDNPAYFMGVCTQEIKVLLKAAMESHRKELETSRLFRGCSSPRIGRKSLMASSGSTSDLSKNAVLERLQRAVEEVIQLRSSNDDLLAAKESLLQTLETAEAKVVQLRSFNDNGVASKTSVQSTASDGSVTAGTCVRPRAVLRQRAVTQTFEKYAGNSTGRVQINDFRAIVQQCGGNLSETDAHMLLEAAGCKLSCDDESAYVDYEKLIVWLYAEGLSGH